MALVDNIILMFLNESSDKKIYLQLHRNKNKQKLQQPQSEPHIFFCLLIFFSPTLYKFGYRRRVVYIRRIQHSQSVLSVFSLSLGGREGEREARGRETSEHVSTPQLSKSFFSKTSNFILRFKYKSMLEICIQKEKKFYKRVEDCKT